jgi:hypothetical protein
MSRTVRLGDHTATFPSPFLQPLVDSKALYDAGDAAGLRKRFEEDGYLYVRGALDREAVLRARSLVIKHLAAQGNVLVPGKEEEGVLYERCMAGCIPFMEGKNDLTHSPEVLEVLAGERIQRLMSTVLDSKVVTFDFKWLRAAWKTFFTGCHLDRVYMGRGSQNVVTTWIPFDDATLELGALAVLRSSHRLPGFKHLQETYGNLDVEKDNFTGTGWFGTDPREVAALDPGAQWMSGDYSAGDLIMFGMRTIHMSTANVTDRVRISCDIRWQPAADPQDERYFGAVDVKVRERQKAGAWAEKKEGGAAEGEGEGKGAGAAPEPGPVAPPKRTIEELKAEWGFAAGPSVSA